MYVLINLLINKYLLYYVLSKKLKLGNDHIAVKKFILTINIKLNYMQLLSMMQVKYNNYYDN